MGDVTLGIDLGCSNAVVAVYEPACEPDEDGTAQVILNDIGGRTTPSCVYLQQQQRPAWQVGKLALQQAVSGPAHTVRNVKRVIGRTLDDVNSGFFKPLGPVKVVGDEGRESVSIRINHETSRRDEEFSPEEISAYILLELKAAAEAHLGHKVEKAVIAVPASFNVAQRVATKHAGYLAGLKEVQLVNEASAAAAAYAYDRTGPKVVAIVDVGGGGGSVAVVVVEGQRSVRVLAHSSERLRGGEDMDNHMLMKLKEGIRDIDKHPQALEVLRSSWEAAKQKLSRIRSTNIHAFLPGLGVDFHKDVTREDFESQCGFIFQMVVEELDAVLKLCKISVDRVDDVLLVGGSTRIPKLRSLIGDFFGKNCCKAINPDEAVACGAALLAAGRVTLQDVTSLHLQVAYGRADTVVEPRTELPLVVRINNSLWWSKSGSVKIYQSESCYVHKPYLVFSSRSVADLTYLLISRDGLITLTNSSHKSSTSKPNPCLSEVRLRMMTEEIARQLLSQEEETRRVQVKNQLEEIARSLMFKEMHVEEDSCNREAVAALYRFCQEQLDWLIQNPVSKLKEYKDRLEAIQQKQQKLDEVRAQERERVREEARLAAAAETKRQEEEARRVAAAEKKRQEEQERQAAERKRQEEEARRVAAAEKKRQEEEARRVAVAEKKRQEEQERQAAEKKRQEEEEARRVAAAEKKRQEEQAQRAAEKKELDEDAKLVAENKRVMSSLLGSFFQQDKNIVHTTDQASTSCLSRPFEQDTASKGDGAGTPQLQDVVRNILKRNEGLLFTSLAMLFTHFTAPERLDTSVPWSVNPFQQPTALELALQNEQGAVLRCMAEAACVEALREAHAVRRMVLIAEKVETPERDLVSLSVRYVSLVDGEPQERLLVLRDALTVTGQDLFQRFEALCFKAAVEWRGLLNAVSADDTLACVELQKLIHSADPRVPWVWNSAHSLEARIARECYQYDWGQYFFGVLDGLKKLFLQPKWFRVLQKHCDSVREARLATYFQILSLLRIDRQGVVGSLNKIKLVDPSTSFSLKIFQDALSKPTFEVFEVVFYHLLSHVQEASELLQFSGNHNIDVGEKCIEVLMSAPQLKKMIQEASLGKNLSQEVRETISTCRKTVRTVFQTCLESCITSLHDLSVLSTKSPPVSSVLVAKLVPPKHTEQLVKELKTSFISVSSPSDVVFVPRNESPYLWDAMVRVLTMPHLQDREPRASTLLRRSLQRAELYQPEQLESVMVLLSGTKEMLFYGHRAGHIDRIIECMLRDRRICSALRELLEAGL